MSEFIAPPLDTDPPQALREAFAVDPFAALAQESLSVFNAYRDPALSDAEKGQRMETYFRTIEALDRATFPNMDGRVAEGVPQGYIPDGFMDMGAT